MISIPALNNSHPLRTNSSDGTEVPPDFEDRMHTLTSMLEVPRAVTLGLLVAVTGMLGPSELNRLTPVLWSCCFGQDARVLAPVSLYSFSD